MGLSRSSENFLREVHFTILNLAFESKYGQVRPL